MSRGAPRWYISVDPGDGDEAIDVSDNVLSLEFEDNERKVDTLRITVDNADLSYFDNPAFQRGRVLRFSFGYESELSPVRTAIIKKQTGGRTLTIEAKSLATAMDRVPRRRRFENMTRSQVARQVAQEYGFSAQNLQIEETEEEFETITQANQTDAQFLRKLAHLQRFEFFVDFDGLHWHKRKVGQKPIRKFIYFTDPNLGSILDFSVDNDITRKPGRVRVKGRDPLEGEDLDVAADNDSETDRDVLQPKLAAYGVIDEEAMSLDVHSPYSWSGLLANARELAAHEVTVASNAQTEAEAKAEARGRFTKVQQTAVKMTLLIIGDPTLVAKSVIEIEGMGTRLSGKYYVKSAAHRLSRSGGYDTELKLITDGFGGPRRGGARGTCRHDIQEALDALYQALNNSSSALLHSIGFHLIPQVQFAITKDPLLPGELNALAKKAVNVAQGARGTPLMLGATPTNADPVRRAATILAQRLRACAAKSTVDEDAAGKQNEHEFDDVDQAVLAATREALTQADAYARIDEENLDFGADELIGDSNDMAFEDGLGVALCTVCSFFSDTKGRD